MIIVTLNFINSSIDVADSFKTFKVDDFKALLFQVIKLKAILKTNQTSLGSEINLYLTLGTSPEDRESIGALKKQLMFSEENQMIFRVEIIKPNRSSYHPELQKKFDLIYQTSLKAWHEQAFRLEDIESRKVTRLNDLFSAAKTPYLAVITHEVEEPSKIQVNQLTLRPKRELHVNNASTDISTEPLLHDYPLLIAELEAIHQDLEKHGGIYGIRRLFRFLSKFPEYPNDMIFIKRFKELFLLGNQVNIQDLMAASGQQLIDICSSWPTTLLKHFLNLAGSHLGQEPKNLEAFVFKMHVFWKTIEPYNVLIPNEMRSYDDDFFARIDKMKLLVDSVSPAWKEYQIKLVFDLNWNYSPQIDALLQESACQWIHPLMFDPNRRISQFFIDAAKAMQSADIDALETYLTYLESSDASAKKYKFLVWFLSFTPVPRLDELDNIIRWLEEQESDTQQSLIDNFFSDHSFATKFSLIDFKTIFELARQKKNISLLQLLTFQGQWHRYYPALQETQWQSIIGLLNHHDAALPSLNTAASFNINYLQTMVTLIFSESEAFMPAILSAFNRYELAKQDAIISILRSLKFEQGLNKPPARVFLNLLQSHLLNAPANILQESQWQNTFPELTFTYFANNINYQQIFDSLEQICQQLADSIRSITSISINTPLGKLGIETLLKPEVTIVLSVQKKTLHSILQGLQEIKNTSNSTFQLDSHFDALKDIERDFDGFFKRELGDAFKPLLMTVLPGLDSSLNKKSLIKDLFIAIGKNFSKIPSPIANFFNKEMLSDMEKLGEEQSIVANMMETQLVTSIRQELKENLETKLICHDAIRPHQLKCLNFLGKMRLSQNGIVNFFNRLQNFTMILSDWPKIEGKCQQFQESPLSIWQLCIKYQQEPNVSCYWRACFDILERLFRHHSLLDKRGAKNFIHLFELILKQKCLFPDELGSNGEINNHTWQIFLNFLDKSLSTVNIYQNENFICLFALGIQFTLKNGQEFQFSKMMALFAELSDQDNQFLPVLVKSLEGADEEKQAQTQILIGKLGPIFKERKSRPWLPLLAILLTPSTLQNHLNDILKILDCIQKHPEFDLLSIIVNDTNRFDENYIVTLSHFIDCFQNMSLAWKTSYQKTFLPQETRLTQACFTKTSRSESPPSWWGGIFSDSAPTKAPINPSKQEPEPEPEPDNYWPIIIRPPYPDINKLTYWLSESNSVSLKRNIEHFDVTPTTNPNSIPSPSDADFSRIIDELECYDRKWSKSQKQELKERLFHVWTRATSNCVKSRRELLEQFHQLYPQLRVHNNREHENELIAILAAIYQKIDQKMPYLTQLLTLLMVLEYGPDHLVAEVDTSEGKATIIAMLAVLKWSRNSNNTVIVLTHNHDLVIQDFEQKKHVFLFSLLNIHAGMIIGDTNEEALQANGIYYTTKDDLRIFREKRRSKGQLFNFSIDYITDEVDELILDESTKINMVKINPLTQNMHWIYPQIHQFIQRHLSHSKQKHTPKAWGLALKEAIFQHNENNFQRTLKLKSIPEEKWLNWIKAGLYVQSLVENIDFIVQELDLDDGSLFTTVPYVNGTPKYGYQLAYLSLEGIPQLLHARLTSPERCFIMEDETSIVSELPNTDFRHCGNFTGFSGSIGGVRELLSLQKILNAKAIRIGRYHPKKLLERPPELLRNQDRLRERILDFLESSDQPFLIVARKIEDAQTIYQYLKKQQQRGKITHKQLQLITGQETETKRRQWLYNDVGNHHFAGETNCITISTQICGRGTDIRVRHPKGLFVILTDVLDPRNMCQNKGRAARAGHPGEFIALYNVNQLYFEWSFLNLPTLSQETLTCWIQQIQQAMIFLNDRERIRFLAQDWCQYYLSTYLDKALIGATQTNIQKSHTKLRHLLAQTWDTFPSCDYNFQSIKILTQTIRKNLRTYLMMIGIDAAQEMTAAKDFKLHLQILDAKEWQTIVKTPDTETFFLNDEESNTLSRPKQEQSINGIDKPNYLTHFMQLRDELAPTVPLSPEQIPWFQYISHGFFSILSWFNPSATKLKLYLNQSWHDFNRAPNLENWSTFYTTLLTAESLQERQAKNRFLRMDYWFKAWNPLSNWCKFKAEAKKLFKRFLFETTKNQDQAQGQELFQAAIRTIDFELQQELGLLSSFIDKKSGMIFSFMRYFYPQTYAILNETYQAWHLLNENRSSIDHREALMKKLVELHQFYEQHHVSRFFPFSYWEPYFQVWQRVDAHLNQAKEDSIELPIDWEHEAQMKSKQRLLYMGHLMCQQQIKTNDIRFYFNVFNSNRFLSDIQQEYELEKKNSDLELEIDELSRYFPQELKSIFNQHYPSAQIKPSAFLTQEECRKLCINVLEKCIVSGNPNEPISLDVKDKQLQVLIHELEQWHERRQLLAILKV